jgi:hypothetical protein
MPIGATGAFWALLGPDLELRRTSYDLAKAADFFRGLEYPQAEEDANSLLHPPSEAEMLEVYGKAELN